MRLARRLAAALLALGLGAAGCKPSSLTPLGIGTREPDAAESLYSGQWVGTTGSGGIMRFAAASGTVTDILLQHIAGGCTSTFELTALQPPIEDGTFVYENEFEEQGRIRVVGTFTSPETCTGTYSFDGRASSSQCPSSVSGSGTFTTTLTR